MPNNKKKYLNKTIMSEQLDGYVRVLDSEIKIIDYT